MPRQDLVPPARGPSNTSTAIDFDAIESRIIQLAHHVDPLSGAIGTPRSHAVAYEVSVDEDGTHTADGGSGYGAYRNPAWRKLEAIVADIEGGGSALCTATGRAANDLAFKLLPVNSHIIIAPENIYTGTKMLFSDLADEKGLQVTYTKAEPAALRAALQPNTKMIFTEPLTNPLLHTADLSALAAFAKEHRLYSVADNTLTPLICQPLAYGFDMVTRSLTKDFSGHNDTFGGAVAINARKSMLSELLRQKRERSGALMSPDTAVQLIAYAKDFPKRYETTCRNAAALAGFMAAQPEVARVHYPDAKTDPLVARQFGGYGGGILAVEFQPGTDIPRFLNAFKEGGLATTADSLGADITLFNWYAQQSQLYRAMDDAERRTHGITPEFVRIATGRGSAAVLVEEFDHAFGELRDGQARQSRPALAGRAP